MLKFALPFLAVAFVQAVSVFAASATQAVDALAGSEWGIDGQDLPFIRFESEGRVTGNGGCNRFFGRYETDANGGLKFGLLASTKMACPQLENETKLLQQLDAVRIFRRDATSLTLSSNDGTEILSLRQRDAD